MLGTSRTGTRFYCPACGAGLRAPQADAGSAIDCDGCGVAVRVPRRPHPLESEADDTPLVSPPAAAAARSGIRLLARSLVLFGVGVLISVASAAAWAAGEGPAAVVTRQPGRLGDGPAAVAALVLGLAWGAVVLRWVGYGRCRPAAAAVRAGGWVTVAKAGAVAGAVGQTLAAGPAVAGWPLADTSAVAKAVGQVGDLLRLAGGVAEFGILFVWVRLLTEAGGAAAAHRVSQYAAAVVAAVGGTVASVCVAGVVVVMALRKHGPPPPPAGPAARLDFAAIPPDGWFAAAGALVVALGFVAALTVQYARLLSAVRAAVAGPDAPGGGRLAS